VQDGDTLNKIAMIHGVSSKDLAYANKTSADFLFPGKVLNVPPKNKEAPSLIGQGSSSNKKN
jgi:LysM repeat protein